MARNGRPSERVLPEPYKPWQMLMTPEVQGCFPGVNSTGPATRCKFITSPNGMARRGALWGKGCSTQTIASVSCWSTTMDLDQPSLQVDNSITRPEGPLVVFP